MENAENEPNLVEVDEVKAKKPGFFKRLRRRFSTVFQRKPTRQRNTSDPCVAGFNDESQKPDDSNSEQRLSLTDDNKNNEDDAGGFRPPAKAPLFVNDFTMELKKSLQMRSKMVEEGQASDAIKQIEMSRSNYSVSEEEAQKAEIERKTFEEKVALFESQISGGSLNRDGKLGDESDNIVGLGLEDDDTNTVCHDIRATPVLEICKQDENIEDNSKEDETEENGSATYELTVAARMEDTDNEKVDSNVGDTEIEKLDERPSKEDEGIDHEEENLAIKSEDVEKVHVEEEKPSEDKNKELLDALINENKQEVNVEEKLEEVPTTQLEEEKPKDEELKNESVSTELNLEDKLEQKDEDDEKELEITKTKNNGDEIVTDVNKDNLETDNIAEEDVNEKDSLQKTASSEDTQTIEAVVTCHDMPTEVDLDVPKENGTIATTIQEKTDHKDALIIASELPTNGIGHE